MKSLETRLGHWYVHVACIRVSMACLHAHVSVVFSWRTRVSFRCVSAHFQVSFAAVSGADYRVQAGTPRCGRASPDPCRGRRPHSGAATSYSPHGLVHQTTPSSQPGGARALRHLAHALANDLTPVRRQVSHRFLRKNLSWSRCVQWGIVEKIHVRSLQMSRTTLVVALCSAASASAVSLRWADVLGRGGLAK